MNHEDKQSEQRVTFFLTLATALVGFAVIISELGVEEEALLPARLGILVVLFLFGLTTLNLVTTNAVYKEIGVYGIKMIREYFEVGDSRIKTFHTSFERYKHTQGTGKIRALYKRKVKGTLVEFMVLSNALLLGGMAFVISYELTDVWESIGWSNAVSFISFLLLYWYSRFMRQGVMSEK